jgi:hypothetical protein
MILLRFLNILSILLASAYAHNELLSPRALACYFEDLKQGDELAVSFQVGNRDPHSPDQLVVDFYIKDPNGNKIHSEAQVTNGDVKISIEYPGRYEYCFSNEASTVATKDVTFHVHGLFQVDSESVIPESLDAEVKTLSKLMQDIKNEQGYIVIRERTHRNTAESTNARVKWWSIFQLIVVAVNSIFQIYYLKRFFEVKSHV